MLTENLYSSAEDTGALMRQVGNIPTNEEWEIPMNTILKFTVSGTANDQSLRILRAFWRTVVGARPPFAFGCGTAALCSMRFS